MSTVPNSNEFVEMLKRKKPRLTARFPLHSMSLFGSVARGYATTDSDVDILVDVDPSIGLEIVTLADEIEKLLGHKVDLVSRRAVKTKMMRQIEEESIDV
jgi:predicted nucleotidyltransferase